MPVLGLCFSYLHYSFWWSSENPFVNQGSSSSSRFKDFSCVDESHHRAEDKTWLDSDIVDAISGAKATVPWHSTFHSRVQAAPRGVNALHLLLSLLTRTGRAVPLKPALILPGIEHQSPVMKTLAEHIFDTPVSDLNLLLRYLRNEDDSDRLSSVQLHQELQQHVNSEGQDALHSGVKDSPLYTQFPPEVRLQILSYLVCVPESIHIYPVKGNPRLGYRLSRCPETLLNLDSGTCACESGFRPPPTPPAYLDTELLLVSKTVRREVLDLMFLHNKFTFTSVRDLANFTEAFTACAAKMQNIRLFQRLSDHYLSCHAANNAVKARARIGNLQRFELNCYLDDFSYYDTRYHDGFITEVLPLAFPRPEYVKVVVKPNRIWGSRAEKGLLEAVEVVQKKLDDVFCGIWASVKEVPISEPPKKRVPECEKEPLVKRGILALGD